MVWPRSSRGTPGPWWRRRATWGRLSAMWATARRKTLLDKFAAAEVDVYLRDITSDIGIPTCAAAADDVKLRDPTLLTTGMGTHTSARVAVLRALTEVAQSRLTQIHGAREDTTLADFRKQIGYDRTKRLNTHWFEASETKSFGEIESFDSDDFLLDIKYMLKKLEEAGLDRVVVVDLTREEIGVPVVRVIVPGLEDRRSGPGKSGPEVQECQKSSSS